MIDRSAFYDTISRIAARARKLAIAKGQHYEPITIVMDIESAHEDCGLDLDGLLAANDADFEHDIFGIRQNMDRTEYPGKLIGKFKPRYASQ